MYALKERLTAFSLHDIDPKPVLESIAFKELGNGLNQVLSIDKDGLHVSLDLGWILHISCHTSFNGFCPYGVKIKIMKCHPVFQFSYRTS